MTILEDGSGRTISYEYISRNWIVSATDAGDMRNEVSQGSDVPLYDRTLFSRYVKVKWLDSKGFDSSKAQDDFNQMFNFMTSKDKSGKILDAGNGGGGERFPIPLLVCDDPASEADQNGEG